MTPSLVEPSAALRASYLAGERATTLADGEPLTWLDPAYADFRAYAASRRGVHLRWGVPTTFFWYAEAGDYLGTLVVRHRLTPALLDAGGHIGYHVVLPHRRRGHATAMLRAALRECRALGLDRALVTCLSDNEPSRRTILANGGRPAGTREGEDRFWFPL